MLAQLTDHGRKKLREKSYERGNYMVAWMIVVTIVGAFAFAGILVGLNTWQENKHRKKRWWLGG